jgi:hypothetical protein
MRRLALLLAVALAVYVSPGAAQTTPPDPYAGIRDLLSRRVEAMLGGDRVAFMATVDSENAEFVERQRRLFDGFQRLGLASYRLDLTERYWPELTTLVEVARYGAPAEPHVLHVEERYRLAGYDRQPALDDLYLTFVRRDGGWRVASDTDLDDLSLYSARKLWEMGPIITRTSEHFLYVSHPDLTTAAGPVLASAEDALDTVHDNWPLTWPERVVILAPSTTEELRRLIQATFDLDVFVAFASSGLDRARDWDLVGHRIYLNWPNFSSFAETTQEGILAHELLHVATREVTGPAVPAFVDEGIAEWISEDAASFLISGQVELGTFDRRLPRDHEFITGSNDEIIGAYQESYTSALFAAERYGDRAVADFYRELGQPRVAPGTSRYHVGRAMQAAFDVSYAVFQDRWADWVENEL